MTGLKGEGVMKGFSWSKKTSQGEIDSSTRLGTKQRPTPNQSNRKITDFGDRGITKEGATEGHGLIISGHNFSEGSTNASVVRNEAYSHGSNREGSEARADV